MDALSHRSAHPHCSGHMSRGHALATHTFNTALSCWVPASWSSRIQANGFSWSHDRAVQGRCPLTVTKNKARSHGPGEQGAHNPAPLAHYTARSPSLTDQPTSVFRYWHEDKRFKGDNFIADEALRALGGERTGGNLKSDPGNGRMGWQAMHAWDLLWSPSSTALKAAEAGLAKGQLCSAVPGTRCLTKKKALPRTLQQAYGDRAFDLTPLTFELPVQMHKWLRHMGQEQLAAKAAQTASAAPAPVTSAQAPQAMDVSATPPMSNTGTRGSGRVTTPAGRAVNAARGAGVGGASDALWILKTAQHLGKGMLICPQRRAVKEVVMRQQAVLKATAAQKKQLKAFVVAQQYIRNPLLIQGRKFGLRLWAVITHAHPLRVYLHCNGLVLFSNHEYSALDTGDLQSHLTNHAQNVDGDVWSLEQLRDHMGLQQYDKMHQQILESTALAFAAAAPPVHQACVRLRTPAQSVCELFGLDFLVDCDLKPWLLEVNATPSMAVEHALPQLERLIRDQKLVMLEEMFGLLNVPHRFSLPTPGPDPKVVEFIRAQVPDTCQDKQLLDTLVDLEQELRRRAGWRPLMGFMPKFEDDQLQEAVGRWCERRGKELEQDWGPLGSASTWLLSSDTDEGAELPSDDEDSSATD